MSSTDGLLQLIIKALLPSQGGATCQCRLEVAQVVAHPAGGPPSVIPTAEETKA